MWRGAVIITSPSLIAVVPLPSWCLKVSAVDGKFYIPSFHGVSMSLAAKRKVRIRLYGTNPADVDQVAKEIVDLAKKMGVQVRGPIPLPTRRLMVTVRRAPSGQGYHTYDHWELRISKRLIDIEASERVLRRLMTIRVPDTVKIELQLV